MLKSSNPSKCLHYELRNIGLIIDMFLERGCNSQKITSDKINYFQIPLIMFVI